MTLTPERAAEIARDLNTTPGSHQGGQYVYGPDGSGGEWYSAGSMVHRQRGVVIFAARYVPQDRRWTADQVFAEFERQAVSAEFPRRCACRDYEATDEADLDEHIAAMMQVYDGRSHA